AFVWHMWPFVVLGLIGMVATFIARSYDTDTDYYVPAAEVERIENARFAQLRRHVPVVPLKETEVA
ncbi:hypothetical protein, partial [Burkholderia ambifaria]|uniref:hypothetical protein n=1 Tax=Burkholderia ambifaria TaxID=152480 RepID=UPI00158D1B5F